MTSCQSLGPAHAVSVPFVPQTREGHCGATALAMVLHRYGIRVQSGALRDLYLPALKGTIPDLVAEAAVDHGLTARVTRGSLAQLCRWLDRGIPVIVLLASPSSAEQGHFAVVTGVNRPQTRIRLHTGRRRNHWCDADTFMHRWKQAAFKAVVIE